MPPPLPWPSLRVLANGLKVAVVERHRLPLVTMRLLVKAGAEADPPALAGAAQMVAAVLAQGTRTRSAREIAEAIDTVGGSLEAEADWDSSVITASVLSEHAELGFELLADITVNPVFDAAELERKRRQMRSALAVVEDDPEHLAETAARCLLFAGSRYGHPLDGTSETLRRLTSADLQEFHGRHYRPANSVLVIVGNIPDTEAFRAAEKFFGSWQGRSPPNSPTHSPAATPRQQVVVVDKPDAVQTQIRVGSSGAPRASPDYYALSIANQILGGPAANRLLKALRSRQGLAYDASSYLLCHRALGAWMARTSTRTEEAARSLETILEEMDRLREHAISRAELETAQAYLVGHLALECESSDGIAAQLGELMIHDLPLDYWSGYANEIRKLTADEVMRVTRRYLDSQRRVIILVGRADSVIPQLRKHGLVRVIPVGRVDFASTSLEKGTGSPVEVLEHLQ